jgi:DNA polymerase IV (DinB-like DNA polymerase)
MRIFRAHGGKRRREHEQLRGSQARVKAGIPISRAKKLAPEAVFLPVNMELYRSISDEVMEILKGHCLTLEQESMDEAFCDITEKVSGFKDAKTLAAKIKEDIKEKLGLTCSIGVAPNKLVAKIASDFQKPDGLTVVKPDEVLQFLAPLKITDLTGVGKKTGERLNELGVKTIGELSEMPAEELIREFGQAKGAWLKQAAQGMDYSVVEEREGTEQIGRITTLKQDTSELNIILNAINQLSEDVHRKLEERKLGFKSIRNTGFKLARTFLAEHPVLLRRVGVRVSNLMEEIGQKTLMEF